MMDSLLNYYYWARDNHQELLISVAIVMVGLQGLVRLTPTKADDGALARIDGYLNKLMGFLKLPNVKREDGKIVTGKHEEPPKSE